MVGGCKPGEGRAGVLDPQSDHGIGHRHVTIHKGDRGTGSRGVSDKVVSIALDPPDGYETTPLHDFAGIVR